TDGQRLCRTWSGLIPARRAAFVRRRAERIVGAHSPAVHRLAVGQAAGERVACADGDEARAVGCAHPRRHPGPAARAAVADLADALVSPAPCCAALGDRARMREPCRDLDEPDWRLCLDDDGRRTDVRGLDAKLPERIVAPALDDPIGGESARVIRTGGEPDVLRAAGHRSRGRLTRTRRAAAKLAVLVAAPADGGAVCRERAGVVPPRVDREEA